MSRKHFFSLIEIAVAMAVAAIGVAAIMALLPIALKSTSDSVGDTLAADAANTVIAQLDRAAWEHFDWIQSLPKSKPNSSPLSDADRISYANELMGPESYKILPSNDAISTGKFVFLFGTPNEKSDFAAEVFCWISTSLKLTTLNTSSGKAKTLSSSDFNKHPETNNPILVRVFIEISWPISKPYKDKSGKVFPRQSRTFVREYFDPTYSKQEKD